MRVLITGGLGFIGSCFALACLERGYEVIIIDSLATKAAQNRFFLLHKKFHIIIGDIRDKNVFNEIKNIPSCIFHFAANVNHIRALENPNYDFSVNALGTINVLEYARSHGLIPLVYISTCKVYSSDVNSEATIEKKYRYDFQNIVGIHEKFSTDAQCISGHGLYGSSKYTGDIFTQEYGIIFKLPVIINRFSTVYGPSQDGSEGYGWVSWFIEATKKDLLINIFGNGKQVRDILYIDDCMDVLMLELQNIHRLKGNIFNIGGGPENTLSILELLSELSKIKGAPVNVSFKERRTADFLVYISDIRKIKKHISWKPKVTPQEGIRRIWEAG